MKAQHVLDAPGEPQESFAALAAAVHPAWHQAIIRLANASERVAFRLEAFMGTPINGGMARHARELIKDLIDFLDSLEADPDLEPTCGVAYGQPPGADECEPPEDAEPSLGSVGPNEWHNQERWAVGNLTDLENEHDGREPDVDDEPSLCGVTVTPGDGGRDLEADLGSLDRQMDQRRALAAPSIWCATDGECG